MAKKVIKKKKLKLSSFLLVLCVLIGLVFCAFLILMIPVKNILVLNNNYLNDDYILSLGEIRDYPKFFLTRSSKVESNIRKSKYIKKVKLNKKIGFVFELNVIENTPLFFDMNRNKYIFDNGDGVTDDEISHNFRVPRLLNYIPNKKYHKFIESMIKVKSNTISKISDIEYQPNDYDKDRFLLYMDDGNMVYLTLTKFKMINHYNEVLKQLDNHKGILYLDNGNHFQIRD